MRPRETGRSGSAGSSAPAAAVAAAARTDPITVDSIAALEPMLAALDR
jgi:hypothetical protein